MLKLKQAIFTATIAISSIYTSAAVAQADNTFPGTNAQAPDPGSAQQALQEGMRGSANGTQNCWLTVSEKYKLPVYLLWSIALIESGMNPNASNVNTNGSVDIGYMQINDSWLPKLRTFGIQKSDLNNPCVSIHVGAWILASNIHGMGYTWQAIGAYNAVSNDKRWKYAQKVYAMHEMLIEWNSAYKKAHLEQKGTAATYLPKPPPQWVKYALNKADLRIKGKI